MKKCANLRGFSLLEVMVASTLLAMMGMMLYSSINSSLLSKDIVEEISKRNQMIDQALARMSRDISMAYLSKNFNKQDPVYITQFKGYLDKLYFSAFGNIVYQKDQRQSDQQVLGYFIDTDKQGRQSLMRRQKANLNLDVEKSEGRAQVLLPDVTKLEFRYYDDVNDKWEERWLADPSNKGFGGGFGQEASEDVTKAIGLNRPKIWRLPKIVKITLTVKMPEGEEVTRITATEIFMEQPLDLN